MLYDVSIIISYSYSHSKVFCKSFLVMTRKVEILESCFASDRAGRQAMESITS
jgi:hypothetical protein